MRVFLWIGPLVLLAAILGWLRLAHALQEAAAEEAAPSAEERPPDGKLHLSAERCAAAGIEVVPCRRATLPVLVHTTGTIEVNADRVAHLGARLPGIALEVSEKGLLGTRVEKGDELATIESIEFGRAQTEYMKAAALLALREKTFERERQLAERKVSSGREVLEAEADLAQARIDAEAARNQLEVLGLAKADIEALAAGKAPLGRMTLRAPIAGTIVEKHLVRGEHVDTESSLFTIADLDVVWLFADVYERDIPRVAKGQRAEARIAAHPHATFAGTITHFGETMSSETRTLRVRIELADKDGGIKPGMFATVDIAVGERADVVCVPEEAVQAQGQGEVVFVESAPHAFERRAIRTGARFGGLAEVQEGLRDGEKVVSSGSFLLKCELEKESFESD